MRLNEAKLNPMLRKVNNALKKIGEPLPGLKKSILTTRDQILKEEYGKLVASVHEIEFRIEELQDQLGES